MKTIKNYLYRFGYKAELLWGLVVTVFSSALFFFTAYAQTPARGISVTNTAEINSKVLCPIFNSIFDILMVVSVIMILWAAFTYMRAQDNPEKVTEATKTITYAAVGIVVALCAKVFPAVVGSIFTVTGLAACS